MQPPKLSRQQSKLNNLFAEQTFSVFLTERYGIVPCCPKADEKRQSELFDYKELFEYYFTDSPFDQFCKPECPCKDLLIEKINIL